MRRTRLSSKRKYILIPTVLLPLIVISYLFLPLSWFSDNAKSGLIQVLEFSGLGGLPFGIWIISVLILLKYRLKKFIRLWRVAILSFLTCFAILGLLTQLDGDLLFGVQNASLGGSVGEQIFGSNVYSGLVLSVAFLFLGLWVAFTKRCNQFAKSFLKILFVSMKWFAPRLLNATKSFTYSSAALFYGLLFKILKTINAQALDFRSKREGRKRTSELLENIELAIVNESLDLNSTDSLSENEKSTVSPSNDPTNLPSRVRQLEEPEKNYPEQKSIVSDVAPVGGSNQNFHAYTLPPTELLEPVPPADNTDDEHELTAKLIEETLAQHGVEVAVAEIRPGPAVTMFGLVPGWNRSNRKSSSQFQPEQKSEARNRVRVDSILAREKDLALALAAPSLRIEAPVPGESVVGVEVPNKYLQGINIRSVVESEQFKSIVGNGGLPVALGQASAGEPVAIDLLSMPHLLIAGATGSGKSVCINSVLSSLILSQQPSNLRLLLVEPKRVELTPYNGIPHLVTPVIVDADRVVTFLRGAISEMLRRYELLEKAGVRNLQSYNKSVRATEFMPYIVICIDELADLMMTSAFDVEQSICRLAQLGRATGIHMVVATQRPSVDVVTGLIKANFPSRISFAVASQVDSRTILDASGAERLLGKGDMLFLSSDAPKPRRVQGAYVSESDTEALATHWRIMDTPDVPEIDLEYLAIKAERDGARLTANSPSSSSHSPEGNLYEQAIDLASRERQLSTSLLQRRLRIGYPRAARLMDQLEDEGIVGPNLEPGKPRPVLYTPDLT